MWGAEAQPWPFGSGADWDLPKANLAPNYTPPTQRWQAWRAARRADGGGDEVGAAGGSVAVLPGDSPAEDVLDALARGGGAVVLSGRLDGSLRAAAAAALPGAGRFVDAVGPRHGAALLAEPLVMELGDAVLSSQALRMGPTGLARRVVPPGNFTQNRPILQLPWECDYIGARGEATAPENAVPPIPSLVALDTQLTVIWQLADAPEPGPAGWLHAADGSRVEVPLPVAGDVLIAVGGGPGRWHPSGSGLLAVGYQLGVLSPAQNFYLEYSPDDVRGYPIELQRLLGFHMPVPSTPCGHFASAALPHQLVWCLATGQRAEQVLRRARPPRYTRRRRDPGRAARGLGRPGGDAACEHRRGCAVPAA